jgi:hypothetical protein
VTVQSIHRNKAPCRVVRASQSASLGLNQEVPGLRNGMVLLSAELKPVGCLFFQVSISHGFIGGWGNWTTGKGHVTLALFISEKYNINFAHHRKIVKGKVPVPHVTHSHCALSELWLQLSWQELLSISVWKFSCHFNYMADWLLKSLHIRDVAVSSRNDVIVSIPVYLTAYLQSTSHEQQYTYSNDAATVRNIFGTPIVE